MLSSPEGFGGITKAYFGKTVTTDSALRIRERQKSKSSNEGLRANLNFF